MRSEDGKKRAMQVWVEKAAFRSPAHEFSTGGYLWSPRASQNGSDIYRFMREVRPADLVIHICEKQFIGFSSVASGSIEVERNGGVCYVVRLQDFEQISPPIDARLLLAQYAAEFADIASRPGANVFFLRSLRFRQGAYLTRSPLFLVDLLAGLNEALRTRINQGSLESEKSG